MSIVQEIVSGVCPKCGSNLPTLEREGTGWPTVDCPGQGCHEWFDVYKYRQAGGKEL